MAKRPLALWVFGPVAAGKSQVLASLPLHNFRRIDQDEPLERELSARGWHARIAHYDTAQLADFERLRAEVAAALWRQVPGWRTAGENLAFETTGNKPHLFRAEIEAGRGHGYETLGCALRCPLECCLARNAQRLRMLPEAIVESTWRDFEQALRDGVYAEIFAQEQLHVCNATQEAVEIAAAWLNTF